MGLHPLAHELQEQLVLGIEIVVEGALGYAGAIGHILKGGALEPQLGEHLEGGIEHGRAANLGGEPPPRTFPLDRRFLGVSRSL